MSPSARTELPGWGEGGGRQWRPSTARPKAAAETAPPYAMTAIMVRIDKKLPRKDTLSSRGISAPVGGAFFAAKAQKGAGETG